MNKIKKKCLKKYCSRNWFNKKKDRLLIYFLAILGASVIIVWSFQGTHFSIAKIIIGFPYALDFIKRSIPPDFSSIPSAIPPIIETIQISIIATIIGAVFAIPISFLAARNTAPFHGLYVVIRSMMNVVRSVPSMLIALLFVAMVGLGPFPGCLALSVVTVATLTKLFSEALESIDEGPIEAILSTGASHSQMIAYAVIPQILSILFSHILYAWEINVRGATVLGLVGAGGVGFSILSYLRLFQYRQAAALILCVVIIVCIIDYFSRILRRNIQ